MTTITTERVLLRPPERGDVDDLFAVFSNPEAMRYWSKPAFTAKQQVRDYIDAVRAADPATTVEFVVEHRGRAIGKAGFWRMPEIGYILHPDCWGKGLGFEVLFALIGHGFTAHGMTRVIADVDPGNEASIRLLAKLGFVETGREENTLRIGDDWFDSVYFALDRAGYEKARQR